MQIALRRTWGRLTWAQQFLACSLCLFIIGMVALAWFIADQIERSVAQQTAANTALYVSSVVEPNLQELATGEDITPEHQANLTRLLRQTAFGNQITMMKVWHTDGHLVYDTDPENIGRVFPIDEDLATALRGWVRAEIGNTDKDENVFDSFRGTRQLETYSPLRRTGTNEIIAAVEFYQRVDDLDANVARAQLRSWLWIGGGTVALYLALVGFVRYGSATIQRQQRAMRDQVAQLSALLAQNTELHERVQRATRRTTAINERFLRRISADLHDGPAQDLSFALLRLDQIRPSAVGGQHERADAHFDSIEASLRHAIQEIRSISSGLGLPELDALTLAEVAARAVRAHERRTDTPVALHIDGQQGRAALALKITVYRIIQEALQNAYRHGAAAGQRVSLTLASASLRLEISDQGPGFDQARQQQDEHLGLIGMRERVESLGGSFRVESAPQRGVRVSAYFVLENMRESDEQ